MREIEFTKVHCGGNDFVLVDARVLQPMRGLQDLARQLCARKVSVGGDGLLAVSSSNDSDLAVTYLNRDGSRAQFCGNGLLSVARWIAARERKRNPIRIEWKGRTHDVWVSGDRVRGELPPPEDMRLNVALQSGGTVDYVVIGVPHVVRFDAHIGQIDVSQLGRKIRSDPLFAPDGTNVNFCQQTGGDRLMLRTYERGLEAETLSCGSGAAAAAYIAYRKGKTGDGVEVDVSGGSLTVRIEDERIFLEGNPRIVFRGFAEEL